MPIQFCTVAPTSFEVASKFWKNHAPPVKTTDPPAMFRQQPFVYHDQRRDLYYDAAVRGSPAGSQHVRELENELSFSPDEHYTS